MTAAVPRILPCGDQALSFELSDAIDDGVNARVIALAAALRVEAPAGVTEVVPTYRALLVRYDPERIRGAALEARLLALHAGLGTAPASGRHWRVPVVYGGAVGQDLAELAAMKGLSEAEVIACHAGADYRVHMIGFAPGFAYLGGLPEVLHTPRLPSPRQMVPQGAIGIGGRQANINSVAGPSGWRFLGWTPVRLFEPRRDPPFLLEAGDHVRFVPVSTEDGAALDARAAQGDPLIAPEAAPLAGAAR